jgi:Flp pilus assembly protein TadD
MSSSTHPPSLLDNALQQAIIHHQAGRMPEAEKSYHGILQTEPNCPDAYHNLGILMVQQGKVESSLPHLRAALERNPERGQYWLSYAESLLATGEAPGAVAVLQQAQQRGLSGSPVNALMSRAQEAMRVSDSDGSAFRISIDERVFKVKPDFAEAHNELGNALVKMGKLDAAVTAYGRALSLRPDMAEVHKNLAWALRLVDAVARHDREQRDYLTSIGIRNDGTDIFRLTDGSQLAGPVLNPRNTNGEVSEPWRQSSPKIVVIDDFLTSEALSNLRRFCWGSRVWKKVYEHGYLGAFSESGLACPLLTQIADELRRKYPTVFVSHPLSQVWAFKYDSQLPGTEIHADFAAINVNFWITPDDANLDPKSGGLIIWDKAAPPDWNFAKYNGDTTAAREFLAEAGARSVTIPYRSNRAVIFDSDLFHETDRIVFKEGYINRRINITLLYGERKQPQ